MALPTTNIRAAYDLDDGTGNLVDGTGNGYTLTNTNSVTFASGLINQAAQFGTSNTNKILETGSCGVALADDWTVAFFWKAATALNGLSIMEVVWGTSGSGNNNRTLYGRDQGNNRWIIFNSAFSSGTTAESITNGNWYHIMVTRSSTTLTLYVNNTSKGTVSVGAATNLTPRIGIGSQNDAGWRLSGDIDMWYVWNKALDSTERADVYNGGTGAQYAGGGGGGGSPTPLRMLMGVGS